MKQPKSKLTYQHFQISSLDAAAQSDSTNEQNVNQKLVPIQPAKIIIPIPSLQILPPTIQQNKNYLQKRQFQYAESGSLILNSHNLKLLCVKQGLYQFPELNKKLYLHFKCIEKIQNLGQYVNLKTLYLQNNVIKKIQNLGCLPLLQNLFLQHNMITKIQNLQANKNLLVLNISYNNIFVIEGLSQLPHLQNLTLTNNYFDKFQSVAHLGQCTSQLTSIDLSGNRIVSDPRLFDLVPQVKCLYLSGNPLVRQMDHYRRTVVGKLKHLLYLDQRAVAQDERLLAQKWVQQGAEGMKKVKAQLDRRKLQRKQQQKQQIMKDINSHRSKKILIFTNSINQLEEQISKLKQYLYDPTNVDMQYYYTSQIQDKQNKIRQLREFIENINCRIQGRQPPKKIQIPKQQDKEQQPCNQFAIQDISEKTKQPQDKIKQKTQQQKSTQFLQQLQKVQQLAVPQLQQTQTQQSQTSKTNASQTIQQKSKLPPKQKSSNYSYDQLD